MRHSQSPNETDTLAQFKENIDKLWVQISGLSDTDKSEAFNYVYKHLQTHNSSKSKPKNGSRRKTKHALHSKRLTLVKKRKLKIKRSYKCPACTEIKNTKIGLFKHLECLHVDVPLSCLRCRKTFNSQTSYLWHVSNLCGRKKRISNKQFRCPECSKEFTLRGHLVLHQAGHKKNNCQYCNTALTKRSQLINHLLVKHNVKLRRDSFTCEYCKKCFIKRRSLYCHLQTHLTSEFVCTQCGNISKCLSDHKNHQEEHASRKPWRCPHCNEKFARRQLYFAHLHRHERYKCVTCNESFALKAQVSQHKRKGHKVKGLEARLHCPHCQLTFYRRKLLEKHMTLHKERSSETCKYCNKVFNTLKQYCDHCFKTKTTAVVEEVEVYICEYCGQQYTKKYLFDQHLVKDHDQCSGPYSCEYCNYTSKFKPNISRHMGLHFAREKQFICDYCGKLFSNGAVLTDHINYVHRQAKLFKCSLCDKSFKRNTELTRHQSTHSSLRPYNCVRCSNSYKRISHLRRHEKNIHGIVNKTNQVQRLTLSKESLSSTLNKEIPSVNRESAQLIGFDFTDLVVSNDLSAIFEFVEDSAGICNLRTE